MTVSLEYLIPFLRLSIGDIDSTQYRYMDEWLLIALQVAVKSLGRWWNNKYLLDSSNEAYRNTNTTVFEESEPPVILAQDEIIIVLMASLILLEGSLESSAWSTVSWKDAEVSFSNLESGRIRNDRVKRIWDQLTSLITPPTKKLAGVNKRSLPGYLKNKYERDTEY
ncbi:MAG: hypothetical protein GYA36_18350 [Veillonellaceae bacterium]|nr:hypothetical protein [Veillonellaceae bacterium]